MDLLIPKDFILMLSGVPYVGKTTTAYNLLKRFPEFRRVSELDIIRTIVRHVIRTLENENYLDSKIVHNKYCALFESLSEKDLMTSKEQSKLLIPYVKEIVVRQQMRKIPTIIEGSSIIPSTYFNHYAPIEGFQNHVLFINLYLSDLEEHIQRRINRCNEREYSDTEKISREKIMHIRNSKNLMLHQETMELGEKAENVFSIDITTMEPNTVVYNIKEIIRKYLDL